MAGSPPGPMLGMKAYDGQRVPAGTIIYKQFKLEVMPGWNVSMLSNTMKKADQKLFVLHLTRTIHFYKTKLIKHLEPREG